MGLIAGQITQCECLFGRYSRSPTSVTVNEH